MESKDPPDEPGRCAFDEVFSPLGASTIRIHGKHFLDSQNRVLHLRGVNLSGSSKVPSSSPSIDISDPSLASYIDRPFPLEEAPTHWKRLKRWGLTYMRVTVTWEAIEHAGPGEYDEAYLEYMRQLLESMTNHGLICYVCMHQDVWSRLSGGSGAPGWTLRCAGFDLSSTLKPENLNESSEEEENILGKMEETGAAYVHGIKSRGKVLQGDRGLWPTGYTKLACATMNTLFWAGKTFAPSFFITNPLHSSLNTSQSSTPANAKQSSPEDAGAEIHIQDFLQERYLAAFGRLVEVLDGVEGVLGLEMMNEPHPGYIGMKDLHNFNYNTDLHLGTFPSPLQTFCSGGGHPVSNVPVYTRTYPHPTRVSSHTTLNPRGLTCWLPPDSAATSRIPEGRRTLGCPWERDGVWAWDRSAKKAVVLKEGYFHRDPRTGEKVDLSRDFYLPFVQRWEGEVRKRMKGKGKMLHVEGVPNEFCPDWPKDLRPDQLVFSPHWYDLNALFSKSFGTMTVDVQGLSRGMFILRALYFGKNGVKKNYAKQIRTIVEKAQEKLGGVPLIIGETGIPIDMNGGEAFRSGDCRWQERMMNALISALEASSVGFNLWTYNPDNSDVIGDDWNSENFSWFSTELMRRRLRLRSNTPVQDSLVKPLGWEDVEGDGLDIGGILLKQIVRPYAMRTAGVPISSSYDSDSGVFTMSYANPPASKKDKPGCADQPVPTTKITEIFLPPAFLPSSSWKEHLTCSDGHFEWAPGNAILRYVHEVDSPSHIHKVVLSRAESPMCRSSWRTPLLVILLGLWLAIIMKYWIDR